MLEGTGPKIPTDGAISSDEEGMPETMRYDPIAQRLYIGSGYIERVAPKVWEYQVSGKQVLWHWFSYRAKDRSRPSMGDRRAPSPLAGIQPSGWLPEYTTEMLNVLHVLGRLVELEPVQDDLLKRVCNGPTFASSLLRPPSSDIKPSKKPKPRPSKQPSLLVGL